MEVQHLSRLSPGSDRNVVADPASAPALNVACRMASSFEPAVARPQPSGVNTAVKYSVETVERPDIRGARNAKGTAGCDNS